MCGYQIIRYVHHMYHPESGRSLDCGCICAGKLEGDISKARARESAFKNIAIKKIPKCFDIVTILLNFFFYGSVQLFITGHLLDSDAEF